MTASTTPAAKKKAYRHLTKKQWAEAEALWESGAVTYEDLAKKYGSSVSTFERHFRKHAIVKGAKADLIKRDIEKQITENAITDAALTAARVRETKETHYKMASGIAQLAFNEILQAKKDGKPVAVAMNNLKALNQAMDVLKKSREEKWIILRQDRPDAVDPDELPELVIGELTPEQIQEMRDRDTTELDQLPAGVTAAGVIDVDLEDEDEDNDDGDGVVEEH